MRRKNTSANPSLVCILLISQSHSQPFLFIFLLNVVLMIFLLSFNLVLMVLFYGIYTYNIFLELVLMMFVCINISFFVYQYIVQIKLSIWSYDVCHGQPVALNISKYIYFFPFFCVFLSTHYTDQPLSLFLYLFNRSSLATVNTYRDIVIH